MSVSQNEIEKWLFDLLLRRESLADLEKPMQALASMCQSKEEFDLVTHTAEKLLALSDKQFTTQIGRMVKYIREEIINDKPLAIVATAWGNEPDSSQLLLQRIKPLFSKSDNVKLFNSVNQYEKKSFIKDYPRFVLVDEFSGTGSTILNRINHITKQAQNNQVNTEGFACLLFGMEQALGELQKQSINAHFCTELKAGISGYFEGLERTTKIATMRELEKGLAPTIDGIDMPSLGKGQAEALYFVQGTNAPNSNFPLYWWPQDAAGNERITVMQRSEL